MLRPLEHKLQLFRHALRALCRADHDLHRAHVRAVHAVGSIDRILERPRRMADLADAHANIELVIETQRRTIFHVRLANGEVDTTCDEVALVHHAEMAEVCDTAHLRVEQIVGVVHDLLRIGFAKTYPLAVRERERLHARQVTGLARSLLASTTWRYDTMTTRPSVWSVWNASSTCTTAPR